MGFWNNMYNQEFICLVYGLKFSSHMGIKLNNSKFSTQKFDLIQFRVKLSNRLKNSGWVEFEIKFQFLVKIIIFELFRTFSSFNWFTPGHTQNLSFKLYFSSFESSQVLGSNSNQIESKILEIFWVFLSLNLLSWVMHLLKSNLPNVGLPLYPYTI